VEDFDALVHHPPPCSDPCSRATNHPLAVDTSLHTGSAAFMSQQDTGLDPANGDDPSVAEPSDAASDVIQVPQKSAEEEAAEAEAAAAERARQILEQQVAAVDDAEELCVFLVEDTLTAMFQEMQVLAENASVFTRSSAWASDNVFAGVHMSATQASTSLDRSDTVEGSTSNGVRQQILKLDEDGYGDAAGTTQEIPGKRSVSQSETTSSSLRFLRRLLAFIEGSSDQVGRELMTFPAARFVQRGIPSRSTNLTAVTNNRVTGDWEIPSGSIEAFLTHMIDGCHVRVLPSTARAVLEANAAAIDAKARAKATLSLNQITLFVRKALLAAEQDEGATQEPQPLQQADDTSVDWSQRTFPTEVAGRFSSRRPSDQDSRHTRLRCCFLEEVLPVASGIDRNVPGSIARKVPDPSQRLKGTGQKQLARRVIMAMMPGPKESSRWLGLRTRVVHDSDPNIVQVAVDADMEVSIDSKARVGSTIAGTTTKPTLSPKKPPVQFSASATAAASPTVSSRASKLAGRSFSVASNAKDERPIGSPITVSTTEPDTAALSNIFSLGTPRQLNGDELARRNDILAQLERDEMQQQRRLANASIAAMTFPPSVCPSDAEERAFRAYVTANSSITTGVDFDFELPLTSLANDGESSPPLAAPRRPEKKNTNQSPIRRDRRASGATGGRSKFEVACDPPVFAVHDGSAHDNVLKEAGVPYSPIRKANPSKLAGPPSPPTALDGTSMGNGDLSPIRPVQSAGHHLPQLDTSRLVVGVRAVVRGVEKRGPRQNPSRQSRLKLHNYNVSAVDV
jgi:hypothetical protein